MKKWLLLGLCVLYVSTSGADSFRCGRKLVKVGESSNALVKKCGSPTRKYSARATVSESGRQRETAVSNWVYERRGRRDMIVSVRGGTVVRLEID